MVLNNKKSTFFWLIFSFAILATSLSQATVVGNFKNAPATAKIYLYQYFGTGFYLFDSASVTNGSFKFSKTNYPNGFYQIGTSKSNSFQFILASEDFEIKSDWKNIKNGTKILASKENEAYKKMVSFNTKLSSFEKKVAQIEAFKNNPTVYNSKLTALQKSYDSINTAFNVFKSKIILEKSPAFFAKVLGMFAIDETTPKESFFTEAEKTDDDFTRGDMMFNKIGYFFQKYGKSEEKTWRDEAKILAEYFPKGSQNQALVYVNIAQIFLQNQLIPDKWVIDGLKTDFAYLPAAKEIINILPKPQPEIGDVATDITLLDVQGKNLSLSSLRGKIVLLDFWASWCGPCRMENPNVVNTYQQYKDKGFTIFSVSLDNNKANWLKAIEQDGLVWTNHVSDLKGWQSAGAALYQVKGIPATFLIDKNGIIVAKNLRGAALQQKLSELLP